MACMIVVNTLFPGSFYRYLELMNSDEVYQDRLSRILQESIYFHDFSQATIRSSLQDIPLV